MKIVFVQFWRETSFHVVRHCSLRRGSIVPFVSGVWRAELLGATGVFFSGAERVSGEIRRCDAETVPVCFTVISA